MRWDFGAGMVSCLRRGFAIFTTDRGFERYARLLPIHIHRPDPGGG